MTTKGSKTVEWETATAYFGRYIFFYAADGCQNDYQNACEKCLDYWRLVPNKKLTFETDRCSCSHMQEQCVSEQLLALQDS